MIQKKGSKNAFENRGGRQIDNRGEQVQVMIDGKKQILFQKEDNFYNKRGTLVQLD